MRAGQTGTVGEGDPALDWDDIIERYAAGVFRVAYRLTGSVHDAEDLTQEAFFRAYRARSTLMPDNIGGWLYRITTNLFLDQMRRRTRLRFEPLTADRAAGQPGPDQMYVDARFDHDVQEALDSLSPDFKAVLVWCDIENIGHAAAAEMLGINPSTLRTRLHRARAHLRRRLAHRAPRSTSPRPVLTGRLRPDLCAP